MVRQESGLLPISGTISTPTTWGPIAYVIGNVTVNPGITLQIPEGTMVTFKNSSSLTVNGTLSATNATFDRAGTTNWGGIIFNSSSNSSLNGCNIYHANNAVVCNNNLPIINGCNISYNNVGIWLNNVGTTSRQILNNVIHHNSSHGIYCSFSSPYLLGNYIDYSGFAGVFCLGSSPWIYDNQIISNSYGLYLVNNSQPKIYRSGGSGLNRFVDNNIGIYADGQCNTTVSGNDFFLIRTYAVKAQILLLYRHIKLVVTVSS